MINSSGMVLWITVHLSIYFYFLFKSKADTCSLTLHRLSDCCQQLNWIHKRMTNCQQGHALAAAGILWNVSLWDGFQGEPLAIGFVAALSAGEKLVLSMYSNL